MDERSFISSFRDFRRVPKAALFAIGLFIVAELALALVWRPSVVGEERYANCALSYDYAYASDFPRLFREGETLLYYPTEYADIREFGITRTKTFKEIRVFVLGASVTRAADVPLGKAYPEQLQRILVERHPEYDWRVINLAASGFGTTRMLGLLQNMVAHEPDAIIVHPHGTNEYEDERDARYRDELHSGLNGLFLRSRVIVFLKKMEAERMARGSEPKAPANAEQIAGADPVNRARWMATMTHNIAMIQGLAQKTHSSSIYVGRAARDGESYLGEDADRLNGPIHDMEHFVDVAAVFTETDSVESSTDLFLDWTHYTERGHRIVAEELYELLRPGGMVFQKIEQRNSVRQAPGS